MPEVVLTGAAGRIEGRYSQGKSETAPVALILDVPDLATREECEATRAAAGSKEGDHLYFSRDFFAGETWTNPLQGYGNAPFRFHCHQSFR